MEGHAPIYGLLNDILTHLQSMQKENFPQLFNKRLQTLEGSISQHYEEFKSFIQSKAQKDDTWTFWNQFVFQDAMAYVGLFLAIRSGDWDLRMGSMKSMAPVFTAFDHSLYQILISAHVSDLLTMPKAVISMFRQGAFVVSINERSWHSVAIDELHEMLINKDCKTSVIKSLPDYIGYIVYKIISYGML